MTSGEIKKSSDSVAKNAVFNLIRTVSRIPFPLITFTYASHILGVNNYGRANFALTVVQWFVMLAALGMDQYGTREVAKVRGDRRALSKLVREILCINLLTTLIAYAILILSLFLSGTLHAYMQLILIYSAMLPLSLVGMDWLFQGLEEYRYLAFRSVLFRILSLVVLFVFVRDAGDVAVFALVQVIARCGAGVMTLFRVREVILPDRAGAGEAPSTGSAERYEVRKHLAPLFTLFAMVISIEIYKVFDVTMLGFLKGDEAVGIYSAAVKVNTLLVGTITAAGVVLVPRLSFYVGTGEREKLRELVSKGYGFAFLLSVPFAVGLFMLSGEIIRLLCGPAFAEAAGTMRMIMPVVLLIPFSVMTNQQTLVPLGEEKRILVSTLIGAVVNVVCNLLLIPRYGVNGAAIGTVAAELAVAFVCFHNASLFFDMRRIFRSYYQYWVAALPIIPISLLATFFIPGYVLRIAVVTLLSVIAYAVILWMFKNPCFMQVVRRLKP